MRASRCHANIIWKFGLPISVFCGLFFILVFSNPIQGEMLRGQMQQVNIYGDNNPTNGVEDNRIDMSSPQWNTEDRHLWNMGAGTIHCEGQNRGSAVILDTSEFGKLRSGFIVATSAHVLFDLKKNRLFTQCSFHYMALDHLPGYQAEINFDQSSMGDFNPESAKEDPDFGKNDWAFLYIDKNIPGVTGAGRIRVADYHAVSAYQNGVGSEQRNDAFQFISYSKSTGSMTISTTCNVTESGLLDIGGGSWEGQLLDDCDSEGGASGGGIITSINANYFLVGIRSGAHWDRNEFPNGSFPGGPPDGSTWDIAKNTNFGRAIDGNLIDILRTLVQKQGNNGDSFVFF